MSMEQLKYWAYFAHVSGLLAVILGFLALNGIIESSLISKTEAVLGLAVGAATVYMGQRALKILRNIESGDQ